MDDPIWISVDLKGGSEDIILRLEFVPTDPELEQVRRSFETDPDDDLADPFDASVGVEVVEFPQIVEPQQAVEDPYADVAYASPEHVEWVVGLLTAAAAAAGHEPRHALLLSALARFQECGPTWARALAEHVYAHGVLPRL